VKFVTSARPHPHRRPQGHGLRRKRAQFRYIRQRQFPRPGHRCHGSQAKRQASCQMKLVASHWQPAALEARSTPRIRGGSHPPCSRQGPQPPRHGIHRKPTSAKGVKGQEHLQGRFIHPPEPVFRIEGHELVIRRIHRQADATRTPASMRPRSRGRRPAAELIPPRTASRSPSPRAHGPRGSGGSPG
jgi:hypothetical protein